jgi:hypothetical protein
MIPEHMLPHEVVVVDPASTLDAYNNPTPDYGDSAARRTVKAWLQQDAAQIVVQDGGTPLEASWLMVTNDTAIGRLSRIEWGDVVFKLDGQPEPAYTPGALHHAELKLTIVDG